MVFTFTLLTASLVNLRKFYPRGSHSPSNIIQEAPIAKRVVYGFKRVRLFSGPPVHCKHRYAANVESPQKKQRQIKNDVDFSSQRASEFGDRRLADITFDEVMNSIQEDWEIERRTRCQLPCPSFDFARR